MAPVVCLSGALPVAHRQDQAGSKKAAKDLRKENGHAESEHALNQIGADYIQGSIEGVALHLPAAFLLFLIQFAQAHCGKAEAETVVGQHFQHGTLEQRISRDLLIKKSHEENDKSAKHARGDHQFPDKRKLMAKNVRKKHGDEENG